MQHALTNWKTTLAGLLISIVTITGVLASQGVTLGHAGTGTVVTLIGAVATALLGVIARDPGKPAELAIIPKPNNPQP